MTQRRASHSFLFEALVLAALLVGALLLIGGCGGKSRPEAPAPRSTSSAGSGATSTPGGGDADAAAAADAAAVDAARRREAAAMARAVLEQRIYFDFDRSDLTPQARATLDAKLEVFRNHPGVTIVISGHADERGSDEYNLALGNRRANSVKQYLVAHGVLNGRLATVSYGEERPAAGGHDESSWSQNRRAEFEITGGVD